MMFLISGEIIFPMFSAVALKNHLHGLGAAPSSRTKCATGLRYIPFISSL